MQLVQMKPVSLKVFKWEKFGDGKDAVNVFPVDLRNNFHLKGPEGDLSKAGQITTKDWDGTDVTTVVYSGDYVILQDGDFLGCCNEDFYEANFDQIVVEPKAVMPFSNPPV